MSTIGNTQVIANGFNEYYATIIEKIIPKDTTITDANTGGYIYPDNRIIESMCLPRASTTDIISIIDSLKKNSSPGIDNIKSTYIIASKFSIAELITYLLNTIFETGIIPEQLKISIVRPIYKGGIKNQFENYRPIMILPVMEKILEKFILIHLKLHLKKHKIISNCQHGFQEGKSTSTLLEDFVDNVYNSLNDGKHGCAIFLDLRKAFDVLDHQILLSKLQNIGIRGNLTNLFKNYLQERKITTKINNSFSKANSIKTGVPQGSMLGPLLFLIYDT